MSTRFGSFSMSVRMGLSLFRSSLSADFKSFWLSVGGASPVISTCELDDCSVICWPLHFAQ